MKLTEKFKLRSEARKAEGFPPPPAVRYPPRPVATLATMPGYPSEDARQKDLQYIAAHKNELPF